jgi:succinate dehydrogenase/fumarate reductase flavoprotein subunit
VDQNLRDLFERALDAEPPPPPGDLAQTAMAQGTRLRRRGTLIVGGGAAGLAAVIATVLALNLTGPPDETAPRVAAAAMAPASAGCTAAVRKSADDVSLFLLQSATRHQVDDLEAALMSGPLVGSFTFESREQAYERFKVQWRDNPDLVKAVKASQFPQAFHVKLKNPATYMTFVAKFKKQPGVDQIVGSSCPTPRARSGEGE